MNIPECTLTGFHLKLNSLGEIVLETMGVPTEELHKELDKKYEYQETHNILSVKKLADNLIKEIIEELEKWNG